MSEPFEFNYHRISVPVDWKNPDQSPSITVAVREILDSDDQDFLKPPILYLQGGPGFQSNLPTDEKWISQLMTRFRVFLMDQRGTGLSTPIDIEAISSLDQFNRDQAIEYISNFRADSIARDIEHIRKSLFSDKQFFTFGQSFGGWCTFAYLSLFPNSANGCFLTGGFPPVGKSPLEVYRALVPQVDKSNEMFFEKYPETKSQLQVLIEKLDDKTQMSLAQNGFYAGYSTMHAELRTLIEALSFELETIGRLSTRTMKMMEDPLSFSSNPIYALLHESIYCEGIASNWAAETVMLGENNRPDKNDIAKFFLGENVLRRSFEIVEDLKPLSGLMDALMSYENWSQQFDVQTLQNCEVPVVGTIYKNDAAVVASFAKSSAELLGNGHFIESGFDHSAYKSQSDEIFNALFNEYDQLH